MSEIVRALPRHFPAPIFVVLHIPAQVPSLLPQILGHHGTLRAVEASDGASFENGVIYTAIPDRHLLLERGGIMRTPRGLRENRHRPAIDPLFRSAAMHYGAAAVGVILSGSLDDGTAGLHALKEAGGVAIVQDPVDALYPGMPQNAVAHVDVDHCVPLAEIPGVLLDVLSKPAPPPRVVADAETLREETSLDSWPDTMIGARTGVLEEALWAAMRTLEESARMSRRLAATERSRGHEWLAERFEEKEREARSRVAVIRQFLLRETAQVSVDAQLSGQEPG